MKDNKLWGTLGVIGLFLLTKLKYVLVLLKFAKFSTVISMFISLGVYAMIYGWKFGVAIVYVIFIHEMGHLVAMKIKKIPASPAIFIPFVGAMISVKGEIKDAKTEAFIAYGGPLAGLISILPAIPLYILTEDPLYALIIYLGAFVNLFNLLPVSPLDGGRIVTTLSTHIWALGLLVLLGLNIFMPSPIMILILIFGSITWIIRLSEGKKLAFNEYEENVVKNLMSDIQSCEKSKIQLLTGLYDNRNLDGVQQEKLRLEELESLQRELLTTKSYSFKEKIFNRGKILKEATERDLQVLKIRHEQEMIKNFINQFSEEDTESIETQKEKFTSKVNSLTSIIIEELEQKQESLQKESTKLKTYYKTDTKTKVIWSTLYIGLIVVLGYVFIQSTVLMETISEVLK